MTRFLLPTTLACVLAACSAEPEPQTQAAAGSAVPADAGVCWRLQGGAYAVVDRVPNLPTCAQRLEAVRMMADGGPVQGAFEGRTISVTASELTQGRPGADRYPVFTTGQRAEMQAAIQALLDRRAETGGRS